MPELHKGSYFHSRELMEVLEQVPRQRPYMVVVTDEEGRELSHMLGIVRYRTLILPPYLLIHCRILGEGVYADPTTKDQLLGEMLNTLTHKLDNRVLYIEVSNMSQKMMGYKQLRQAGYYPVNWMSIHNSLHRHAPEERITEKLQRRIDQAHERGVRTELVKTEDDFKAFSRLLRKHHIMKPKRYIPDDIFFKKAMDQDGAELFVTKYHGWVIACAAVAYSEGDAYLWYSAFRRKTFHKLHPDTMVVWDVMKHAYEKGCQHMRFMDVGLPYGKNPYREFILRFGGKEQSTYRWFRFSIRWVNKLLAWIYRE
ncbi:Acetyltransferase (GNAT) domain-containing protein [Xylanibacter ruminicola]|uniref:Acetyltransferase (GNAT) domain-containing protein n=2 Tax=Xylanibacter ruminicola TaxID=839 RepID=A0A1M6YW50_XYLRU|nr:Acetyltransferase (GNAT) domain-containing protein [Xylanibacter ruminicola]